MARIEAVIDLGAIRANAAILRRAAGPAEVMAVVKADGYGHGLLPSARAALAGGATWLGTAMISEALALRAGGVVAPLLAWLWSPDDEPDLSAAVAAQIDLSVSAEWALDAVIRAAHEAGRPARVHLKVDTGLSRNGAYRTDWPDLVVAAAKAKAAGDVETIGIWSHFAYADAPGHPTIGRQIDAFGAALQVAERAGLNPQIRHLANSAATLTLPAARFDLVRPGIALYGLSPVPEQGDFGLRPAMTLQAQAALVKRVGAGEGVSYGHAYTTAAETTLVLVPMGYADGIPRHASNCGPVAIGGERFRVAGRVCMDQFVVDVGDLPVAAGDQIVLFGRGGPSAQDWADAVGTIHYEIVTRIGPRVPRRYLE